jgi:hypothetical protein
MMLQAIIAEHDVNFRITRTQLARCTHAIGVHHHGQTQSLMN